MKIKNDGTLLIKPYELKEMFRNPENFVRAMKQIHDIYGLPYDEEDSLKYIKEHIEGMNEGGI